jgi:hypothetical protein
MDVKHGVKTQTTIIIIIFGSSAILFFYISIAIMCTTYFRIRLQGILSMEFIYGVSLGIRIYSECFTEHH